LEVERRVAPRLLGEVMDLAPSQQRLVIRNSPRFHSWGVIELLLERARRTWSGDPGKAGQLAELALEIAEQLHCDGLREELVNDLRAESWSCIANCRRIETDFAAAREAFSQAEYFLSRGTGDPIEYARLCDLKSSLLRELRDFDSARRMLERAIAEYRKVGERTMEGRALLNMTKLLGDAGKPDGQLAILDRASKLLDFQQEPWLGLIVEMKRVHYLSELGRVAEARAHVPKVRKLARQYGNRLDRLRVLWIEGGLCRNLGQVELAEEAFKQVREGFVAAKIGYDVALVSLDLAALYLETDRTEEARQLATESIPLFASRGVHREALMAWNLFREAAERDALTLGLVREVASRIRQSQSRPAAGGDLA
ncbi:MAG TPA: hypothetical protein VLF66_19360, partial [Thermoanaerobaculia bacterium]|nr:hypothetical protein [Thermoanaerobaculia bacterium]